jgi:hypothetical protein
MDGLYNESRVVVFAVSVVLVVIGIAVSRGLGSHITTAFNCFTSFSKFNILVF